MIKVPRWTVMSEQDCDDVVALMRTGFPARLLAETPFLLPEGRHYLRARLQSSVLGADELHLVAREVGLKAYGHIVNHFEESHLNYVVVAPGARGEGLGRGLIRRWIAGSRAKGVEELSLYVAVDNVPALNLYREMGFTHVGHRVVYLWDTAASGSEVLPVQITNWMHAAANHIAYGVSTLRVHDGERQWHLKQVGDDVYVCDEDVPEGVRLGVQELLPRREWRVTTRRKPRNGVIVQQEFARMVLRTLRRQGCH